MHEAKGFMVDKMSGAPGYCQSVLTVTGCFFRKEFL